MRVLAILLAVLSLSAMADNAPEAYASVKKPKAVTLAPGGKGEAVVVVEVVKGFHVQANPASQPNLIATTLMVQNPEGLTAEAPIYPQGKPHRTQGTPTEIMAYDKRFEIKLPLVAAATAKPGKLSVEAKLRYQACNEKTCFFPMVAPVTIPVVIKK